MKKVITSFGFGNHERLLALSIPTLYLYAQNHNYDLFTPNQSFFSAETRNLPPAWWKIDLISYLFSIYDQVLWIDADVIICRFEEDISKYIDIKDDFGVVVHETPDGQVPNSGVWFLNKSSMKWLQQLKNFNSFRRSNSWWEQAALLHMLGMNPDSEKLILPEKSPIQWTSLDYIWNPHINDHRKIPQDTRFFHATCFPNRYGIMKNIIEQIPI